MKKALLVSSLLLSSLSFAADVDYSRCLQASGVWGLGFDNDGKLFSTDFQKITSMKSEGNKEFYTLESPGWNGIPFKTEMVLERDTQGRIVAVSTGQNKFDQKTVNAYKKMMVDYSAISGANNANYGSGFGYMGMGSNTAPNFMTTEPQFFVGKKMVSLSQMTKEDAKAINLEGDVETLQKLKSQWRKDKKVVEKIKDGYAKAFEKTPVVIPAGQETSFDIQDGVCLVKNVKYKNYNSATKEIVKTDGISRETCEEIQKIQKKYATKLNECKNTDFNMAKEYSEKGLSVNPYGMGINGYYGGGIGGGMYGGIAGGLIGGSFGGAMGANAGMCASLYGVGDFGMGYSYPTATQPSNSATKQ